MLFDSPIYYKLRISWHVVPAYTYSVSDDRFINSKTYVSEDS